MLQRSKIILLVLMIGSLFIIIAMSMRYGFFGSFSHSLNKEEAALRYPYEQLNRREQKLYATLCKGMEEYREIIVLPGIYSKEEYERIYLLAAEQEPQFFYVDDIYETADEMSSVNLFYDTDKEEIGLMRAQMDLVADRILRLAESQSSTAEKLTVIHDEIAKICEYASGPHQNDAYGCLVDGTAKCEGYAKAFLYVARRGGFQVMNVTGTIRNGENHVWNIADIDGTFYNIDVTWDDDDAYRGNVVHSCFAVPDSDFADHRPDLNLYLPPACNETEHAWYHAHGLIAESTTEFPNLVNQWTGDSSAIEIQCGSSRIYSEITQTLQMMPGLHEAVRNVSGAAGFSAVADEVRRVIVIMPS